MVDLKVALKSLQVARYMFIKKILKEGNTILRIDLSDSSLYVYKLTRACGPNNSWIEGTLTHNRGLFYGGTVCLNIDMTATEDITFSEYYVVTEKY